MALIFALSEKLNVEQLRRCVKFSVAFSIRRALVGVRSEPSGGFWGVCVASSMLSIGHALGACDPYCLG